MTTLSLSRPRFELGLRKAFGNVARLFVSIAAAQQAATDFERMNSRTDAALAAQGLRRTDIPRVLFDRHFA